MHKTALAITAGDNRHYELVEKVSQLITKLGSLQYTENSNSKALYNIGNKKHELSYNLANLSLRVDVRVV